MSDINPKTGEPYKVSRKTRKAMKWSPAKRAKFEATLRAKGLIVGGDKKTHARRYRAKKKAEKANGHTQEIPLDAIPDKMPRIANGNGKHLPVAFGNGTRKQQRALADKVHAEYDINSDQMTLVLGKLRLPFRVKV